VRSASRSGNRRAGRARIAGESQTKPVGETIEAGDPAQRKALLEALVDEIRVVSRAEICPRLLLAGGSTTVRVSAPSRTRRSVFAPAQEKPAARR
jgi:hypothetical protein